MRTVLIGIFLALGVALFVPLAAQNPTPGLAAQKRARIPARKLELDVLKLHVAGEAEGSFAPGDALAKITIAGGVAFDCTAEIRDDLRKLKASDAVLRASGCPYPEVMAPPPPPPAPPKPAGPITITCAPQDCEVVVLNPAAASGDTAVKTIRQLPAGVTKFEIRRLGYQSVNQTVELKEGESKSLSALLPPLAGSKRQWATDALLKAIDSTGGFMDLAGLLPLSAQGSVVLTDDSGKTRKYTLAARLWGSKLNWALLLDVDNTTSKRKVPFAGGKQRCFAGTPQTPDKKSQPCPAELQEALQLWVDYQFPFVVERALGHPDGLSAESEKADTNGFVATVDTNSETVKIHLSDSYVPLTVSVQKKVEGDIPLEVEYGEFADVRTAKCPKKVSLTRGAKKVQFEFTELRAVSPDLPFK